MIRTLGVVVLAFSIFGVQHREASAQSLTDLVLRSGGEFDFNPFDNDVLLNAVVTAGLADTLDDPSLDVTLFAPNDLAFILLARDLGYGGFSEEGAWNFLVAALTDLGNGDPIPVLREVLTYHVATRRLNAFQVIFARRIETLQGGEIRPRFFRLRDNDPDIRDPYVGVPLNISADNGIFHSITRVLIPIDLP